MLEPLKKDGCITVKDILMLLILMDLRFILTQKKRLKSILISLWGALKEALLLEIGMNLQQGSLMISSHKVERLKSNWGDKASSMNCLAQVRVYDPLSNWECYIYALNPEDSDEVECIIKVGKDQPACAERWFLTKIFSLFNYDGEGVKIDGEYRPRRTHELFKALNQDRIYDKH